MSSHCTLFEKCLCLCVSGVVVCIRGERETGCLSRDILFPL